MNKYLKNFLDLYSEDDSIVYKAILEKKDWLFKKLYMPCNFLSVRINNENVYPDLFALMDKTINFEPLALHDSVFEDHEELYIPTMNKFNECFRVRYFYDHYFTLVEPTTFWVEIDFGFLDDKGYKDLVANFFPCLTKEELELTYDFSDIKELLKLAMCHEIEGSYVAILDKNNLINDRFLAPVVRKIIYSSTLSENKIAALRELAKNLNVALEEVAYE